jgi:hypothetical protein
VEPKNRTSYRTVLAAAASVVLVLVSGGGALARTQSEAGCDSLAKDLAPLPHVAIALNVDDVDHAPLAPDSDAPPENDGVDVTTIDLSTPLLRLGPRVNSAMEDIFAESELTDSEAEFYVDPEASVPVSPLAESDEAPDATERASEVDVPVEPDDESDLPLLQRQMFRTDI